MAMGQNAIESCRSSVNYFNNGWDNGNYQSFLDALTNDVEYQRFVEQTAIGKELNEKLTKTFNLYGQLWGTLGELGDKTRAFLSAQEALNERLGGTPTPTAGYNYSSGGTVGSSSSFYGGEY